MLGPSIVSWTLALFNCAFTELGSLRIGCCCCCVVVVIAAVIVVVAAAFVCLFEFLMQAGGKLGAKSDVLALSQANRYNETEKLFSILTRRIYVEK